MSEVKHTTDGCPISVTRLRWLQHLAKHGETGWDRMPKRKNGYGVVTNRTWRPMVDSGLITARFDRLSERMDWVFDITDAGRAAITRATGSAS